MDKEEILNKKRKLKERLTILTKELNNFNKSNRDLKYYAYNKDETEEVTDKLADTEDNNIKTEITMSVCLTTEPRSISSPTITQILFRLLPRTAT